MEGPAVEEDSTATLLVDSEAIVLVALLGNGAEVPVPDGLVIVRLVVPVVTAGGVATEDWVARDDKVDVIVNAVPDPMLRIVTTPLVLGTGEKLGRE